MGWKHTACHIYNSCPSHTCLRLQLDKNLKITFASPSKSAVQKNKEKKIIAIANSLRYNHGHNILKLFVVLPNFLSPQVKRGAVISNKHGIYGLRRGLPGGLGELGNVGGISAIARCQQPSAGQLGPAAASAWNSALREKFNFCFSRVFASIGKIFLLAGGLGTGLRGLGIFLIFPNFLKS